MKHYLFSSHDKNSFEVCVEENTFWGTVDKEDAFDGLNIEKDDFVVFYSSDMKSFIAICRITEPPKKIENYPELREWQQPGWHVPVVVRLEKIQDINKPLNEENWQYLETFKGLKNRKSVSASLQSKPIREIDITDYNYIISS